MYTYRKTDMRCGNCVVGNRGNKLEYTQEIPSVSVYCITVLRGMSPILVPPVIDDNERICGDGNVDTCEAARSLKYVYTKRYSGIGAHFPGNVVFGFFL